jgi:hypothetical protein
MSVFLLEFPPTELAAEEERSRSIWPLNDAVPQNELVPFWIQYRALMIVHYCNSYLSSLTREAHHHHVQHKPKGITNDETDEADETRQVKIDSTHCCYGITRSDEKLEDDYGPHRWQPIQFC